MFQHPTVSYSAAHSLFFSNIEKLGQHIKFSLFALALSSLCAASAFAQTPTPATVPTWQYDNTHTGANIDETALTLTNVNVNSFGKLFSLKVDGTLYAQPVYVPGLTMSDGQVHNVLFVATENDSVYAFDADSNTGANANPIWKASLLDATHGAGTGATAVPYQDTAGPGHNGSPDIAPVMGITGTPVIDPATNTIYVVATSKENGVYFSRLHALNILTGAERTNSPVAITATVAGTGNGSSGGQLAFSPLWENQRPALDFYKGYVYIGYAAHGDYEPWHGWLFAYNGTTLAQSAVICFSPDGFGGGIWSSGAGMPIDEDVTGGRMFVVTGNGTHTAGVTFPFSGSTGYGESVIDFHLANGGLTATDDFTAFNYSALNTTDWDLGSGGLLMPPDQQSDHPHLLLAMGKEGRMIVLDRDNLGGYAPGGTSNANALQDIPNQSPGYWGTSAYWNGHVYMWAVPDKDDASGNPVVAAPKMFQLSDGAMGTAPTSQSTVTSAWPGSTFSISSNDEQDGIAWAVRSDQFNTHGPAVLYAFDANDLTKLLYESDTNSPRDAAGPAARYSVPVVTNGKVYVATNGEVDVYGLFNGEPTAAAPVINPNGGTFSKSQTVTLSTTTASADIYYTLNGSTPSTSSTLYAGPITINSTATLKAIASATGYLQSAVTSATFSFPGPPAIPAFSPAAGTYTTAQSVSLSDSDANAKIYYTTDGSTPSASSSLYSGPIQVAASETIKAIAIDPTLGSSSIQSAVYTIQAASSGTFSLSSTATAAVAQGGSTSSTITITPNGGFTGSVALTCAISAGPSGATASPACSVKQPAAISGSGAVTSALTINTQSATTTGAYTATVTGTAGSTVETTTVAFTVTAPAPTPNFSLSATSPAPVVQGGSTSSTITIAPSGGFTGSVALTCAISAGPSGASDTPTCSAAQPASISGTGSVTSKLTINTQAATTTGSYAVKLIGTAGSTVETTTVMFTVTAPAPTPSFAISGAATSPIAQGGSTTSTITLTPSGGFTGSVALTCAITAGPSGATDSPTCSASQPAAISGTGAVTSTLAINTQSATTPGSYTVTVTGTAGSEVETANIAVTVSTPPSFTLSGTPVMIATPGSSAISTITIAPTGGFTGNLAITCAVSGGPSGAVDPPTCSASQPAAISGSDAVTATVTINTTASSTAMLHNPLRKIFQLGGGTFAALLFFCFPFRRRKWQSLFGLLIFVAIAATVSGCGGTNMSGGPGNAGTTAGSYTVTVTATSGSASASTAVMVTVS